jgi:hypothetical protein
MKTTKYNDVTLKAGETITFNWNVISRDRTMMGIIFLAEEEGTTYNGMNLGVMSYNT